MFPTPLFTALLLALTITASPTVQLNRPLLTLPISRRLNLTSVHNLLRHDQARAKALKLRGLNVAGNSRAVINEPIGNQAVNYVASVGIGSPATTYSLIVDTGSSNTWVGAGKAYVRTNTSIQTSNKVSVSYGTGDFSGIEFTDTVSLGNGLTATNQSIGVASSSDGFEGVDGILGIGPDDLTFGTLSPSSGTSIPTLADNLFTQGVISACVISIILRPFVPVPDPMPDPPPITGGIIWGGIDSSQFIGSVTFAPITTTSPAREFWGINQSIRYGSSNIILFTTAGIVDTGTTLILIATNAFTKYKSATGGVQDSTTGLLRINTSQFNALQSLFFINSAGTFELTANAQIFPRSLNADIGGVAGAIYLIVNDIGSNSGEGLDFINGYAFLERFYSVFDTTNKRVGFANTPFTKATTN